MKSLRRLNAYSIIALSIVLGACATEASQSNPVYSEVSASESVLAFDHPDLAGGYTQFFRGHDRDLGGDASIGLWAGDGGFPRVQLALAEVPRGYFFGGRNGCANSKRLGLP